MPNIEYTPDQDTPVHEEGAIRLICQSFQSHESGLPEWLKNSADAYAREEVSEERRVIVVSFVNSRDNPDECIIACIDFVGMTSNRIENDFRIWADPEAATRSGKSDEVQGGHGNGGKCYMTQMFNHHSMLHTVRGNLGNQYGVSGGSIRFGYIPNPEKGRDYPVPNLQEELDQALNSVGMSVQELPGAAREAAVRSDGFTVVSGYDPKGYKGDIPVQSLVRNLREHPQMLRTLEMCRVFVAVDGELYNGGRPLQTIEITPIPGADAPRVIQIPEVLTDPQDGSEVSTTDDGRLARGTLRLRTSDVSMRWKKKVRHNITYKAASGYIGFIPIRELDVSSRYADQIYGECELFGLEEYKQNQRARLAHSPLTRAVERFIAEKVDEFAEEFEDRDERIYDQEEKDALSEMNEALDKWKNEFLQQRTSGLWGEGDGGGGNGGHSLPSGKPARVEISLSHSKAGIGVTFRPRIKFFDRNGRRIRSAPYSWRISDESVAVANDDLNTVKTVGEGSVEIMAECLRSGVKSNVVELEVVHLKSISLAPGRIEVPMGSRRTLEAECIIEDDDQSDDVYLIWTENDSDVVRVSSSGMVYAAGPGSTEIYAGDDRCLADEPAYVHVDENGSRGAGDERGRGFPRVLVSGVDPDPETGGDVRLTEEYPPVWQRPIDVDRNIWWINAEASLAKLYLDRDEGYGYQSREWRIYHLERFIDIISQVIIEDRADRQYDEMSVSDWMAEWGNTVGEVQGEAVDGLQRFIKDGVLPG